LGILSGDKAMWIVWYVATIATLTAMGMVPPLPEVATDEDPMLGRDL
jgi:hypothetical protein